MGLREIIPKIYLWCFGSLYGCERSLDPAMSHPKSNEGLEKELQNVTDSALMGIVNGKDNKEYKEIFAMTKASADLKTAIISTLLQNILNRKSAYERKPVYGEIVSRYIITEPIDNLCTVYGYNMNRMQEGKFDTYTISRDEHTFKAYYYDIEVPEVDWLGHFVSQAGASQRVIVSSRSDPGKLVGISSMAFQETVSINTAETSFFDAIYKFRFNKSPVYVVHMEDTTANKVVALVVINKDRYDHLERAIKATFNQRNTTN